MSRCQLRRGKYNSHKVEVDGIIFASKLEANRYMELKLYLRIGEITDLELQPAFVLQEGFVRDGKRYQAITYKADFRYRENGKVVVEDVKGYAKIKEYVIKKKLLLYKWPGIDFREV